jgi:hypothetical protein
MHADRSWLAGSVVKIKPTSKHPQFPIGGEDFEVEDWWDHLTGKSWRDHPGNPACIIYGMRATMGYLPTDDEVLYGHVGAFGVLVHVSEIEEKA